MIFVTDKGRMANNIFQYGQLYAWGREHGRKTMSMRFAYKYPDFKIAHTRYHHFLIYVLAKWAAKLRLIPTVDFNGQELGQLEMLEKYQHVLVTGWSVRFHYLFQKYKNEIIDLFDFSPKVHHKVALSMQQSTKGTVKLGVHIRRGDYATWCGGRFFFDDSQYIDHIQQFIKLQQGKTVDVYICTNDSNLDLQKYKSHLPDSKVFLPSGSPAEDLCLLSECDYIMGPVSTFTLIASMYHNTPLYWMDNCKQQLCIDAFHPFDFQARQYDGYFNSTNF